MVARGAGMGISKGGIASFLSVPIPMCPSSTRMGHSGYGTHWDWDAMELGQMGRTLLFF